MREMKSSGIDWIGEIPKNWKIIKVKNIFSNHKTIVGNDVDNYERLALTLNGVLKRPKEDTKGLQSENLSTYQILNKDELVFKMIDLANVNTSRVGYSQYTGIVSPVYIILNNNKYSKFGYYYFYNMWQREIFNNLGNDGVRSALNAKDMLNLPFPQITEKEAYNIAIFLNKKITEIDNVIKKTKQTIEDYKLYKQSIITKAVTKGLDETVEMKDSGIEWIGKIPKNYNIKKIKHLGNARNGLTYSPENICDESEGTLVLRSSNILDGKLTFSDNVYVNIEIPDELMVNKDDILLCSRNGSAKLIGKNAIIEKNMRASFGAFMMIFKPKKRINSKYIKYILDSNIFKYYLATFLTSTINQLTNDNFSNMKIVFCDNILEQEMIVSYLDKKCNELDILIKSKENLITELENYKKSLIYEYVTGKKEVEEKKIYNTDNIGGIKINCKDNMFAQAILLCKIIEKLKNYNLGRVKAEKTLYLIEKEVGFDFNNKYVREAAGPLSENIYKCESIISKKNKWVNIKKVKKHIKYETLPNFHKYSQYYDKYFSSYDNQIENIIDIIKNYSTDKAEMVATLYAAWNDFIIKKDKVSDIEIVKDVRENWNDRKKRFNEKEWLEVLEEMKQNGLTPKGNGNLTIIKE